MAWSAGDGRRAVMAGAAVSDAAAAAFAGGRKTPEEHVDMEKRTLIFDSSAFISNARIFHAGETPFFGALDGTSKLFAVPNLVREVRDPMARERMQMIVDKINFVTPSAESMNFVKSFASKTGDLGALSVVDLEVIALTYQLEKERNGMRSIKTEPKKPEFRLPAKQLRPINELESDEEDVKEEEEEDDGWTTVKKGRKGQPASAEAVALAQDAVEEGSGITDKVHALQSELSKLEQAEEERAAARAAAAAAAAAADDAAVNGDTIDGETDQKRDGPADEAVEEDLADEEEDEWVGAVEEGEEQDTGDYELENDEWEAERTNLEPASAGDDMIQKGEVAENEEDDDDGDWINPDNLKSKLEKDLGVKKSVVEVHTVGCVTTDYAMQNVLLQMGLRLLSVDGQKVIKFVRRYIYRCSACTEITREMTKLFCPRCGNSTLVRLPFSIDKKGVARIYFDPNRKVSLRGTRYSIPKPKGGRNCKDLILTEDQIAMRKKQMPRRGRKKKVDLFDPNTKYNAGARQAHDQRISVGYGRRNPNANSTWISTKKK